MIEVKEGFVPKKEKVSGVVHTGVEVRRIGLEMSRLVE